MDVIISKSKSFNQRTVGAASPRTSHIACSAVLAVGSPRSLGYGSPRAQVRGSHFSGISRWLQLLIVIGSLVSFVAIASGYVYVLPSLTQAFQGYVDEPFNGSMSTCNVYDGSWVPDDDYPLYNASECPFAEQGFDCLANGRGDMDYLKWRWKPKNCYIPKYYIQDILEMLRSKRIVFVGDSMSRTQWESLVCLLMSGVENKTSVYEVNGSKITKRIRHLGVHFSTFNFSVEFFRSVFLVQRGWIPRHAPKRVRSTIKLDKMDDVSNEWVDSDVLIFNTGHWWVPGKLFDIGCYFQVGNSVKLGMSIPTAYRTALGTWAEWLDNTIDSSRTRVFFRTFEPSHWRTSNDTHRFCKVTQNPTYVTEGRERNLFSESVFEVVKNMSVPVTLLHVTSMSAFRSDAHVGNWSDNPAMSDCSHWCLPGVPDMWNEILLSYLVNDFGLPLNK